MIRNRIAHAVMRDETKETISIDDGLLVTEVTTGSHCVSAWRGIY